MRYLLALLCCATALIQVVPPARPLRKRVVIVADVSGSMRGYRFAAMLDAVRDIAAQPTDEMDLAVWAFNDSAQRYPAEGYLELPSATAVDEVQAWLGELGSGGDTFVIPALERASAEPEADLVLVTDGVFQREETSHVLRAVPQGRLGVLGIGSEVDVLTRCARRGGLGYWRVKVVEPPRVLPPWK